IPLEPNEKLSKYFNVLLAIGNKPIDISTALCQTKQNLTRLSRQIGELIKIASL
ncbi:MAG: glycerate kinase, partial [Mucilaginibacter sp.]|nr:glycerate kinase [Mucilaginibacter sp.]